MCGVEILIEFDLINMKTQTMTEILKEYLCLFDDHLVYNVHFFAKEPIYKEDESLGTAENENYRNFTVLKKHCTSVSLDLSIYNQWMISVTVTGSADDVVIFYSKKEFARAKAVFDEISLWLSVRYKKHD